MKKKFEDWEQNTRIYRVSLKILEEDYDPRTMDDPWWHHYTELFEVTFSIKDKFYGMDHYRRKECCFTSGPADYKPKEYDSIHVIDQKKKYDRRANLDKKEGWIKV